MVRRPANFTWIGFTPKQVELLEFLDPRTREPNLGHGPI
jgi:hypothetical protein